MKNKFKLANFVTILYQLTQINWCYLLWILMEVWQSQFRLIILKKNLFIYNQALFYNILWKILIVLSYHLLLSHNIELTYRAIYE